MIKLEGTERISQPFRFDVEVAVLDPAGIDVESVAGSDVTLVFLDNDEAVRTLHGLVEVIDDRLETEAKYRTYHLRIVPRIRRFALIHMSDIFIGMSVPEIIEKKLQLVGLGGAFEDGLLDTYPKREFVVQYKETDLEFVSRLLEHLGISYVFQHEGGEDRVLFIDAADSFPPLGRDVYFQGRGERSEVFRISARTKLIPGSYVVSDYNYRTPGLDVEGSHKSSLGFAGGVVEFGAHTKTIGDASALAKVRAQEREAQELVYHGNSAVMEFTAGSRFTLSDHAHIDDSLLLVAVNHHMVQPLMMKGDQQDGEPPTYENSFEAIPAERTFRPPRETPRPTIAGVVTGTIERPTGVSNRFPLIDDEGRYTVRFLFDAAGVGERKASHPVRLAQLSGGSNYGTHFPLRPGIEVMIVFTNGDPDRPIIAGPVPNPEIRSPVTSSESMKSRIKSESGVLIEFSDK